MIRASSALIGRFAPPSKVLEPVKSPVRETCLVEDRRSAVEALPISVAVTAWNSLRYERPIESVSATANTLVQRDADGNFSAGTVTPSPILIRPVSSSIPNSPCASVGFELLHCVAEPRLN